MVEISSYMRTLVRRCYGRNLDGLGLSTLEKKDFSYILYFIYNLIFEIMIARGIWPSCTAVMATVEMYSNSLEQFMHVVILNLFLFSLE